MSTSKDGGPAFPPTNMEKGMSLRDWFAGMALQGLLSNPNVFGLISELSKSTPAPVMAAQIALEHADAMLKEREK